MQSINPDNAGAVAATPAGRSATSPVWRWMFRVVGVAAVAVVGAVVAWAYLTVPGRLITRNLMGFGYATPAATALSPTELSTTADLSVLDVDFATVTAEFGGLSPLLRALSRRAEIEDGWLKVRGVPFDAGWYSDRSGPMFYREITGDFLVETRARGVRAADGSARPTGDFNSTGLIVRDPAGTTANMRWLMYNFGQQLGFYGTEAKTTVPDSGEWHAQKLAGFHSRSTLWLTPMPDDIVEARLRICRIGDEFRFFKSHEGSDGWVEEVHGPGTVVQGNGVDVPTPGVVDGGAIRFVRPDIARTVQVGLISNPGFPPNDGESQFAGIWFRRISGFEACVAD